MLERCLGPGRFQAAVRASQFFAALHLVRNWHWAAVPECLRSRRVLEGKRTIVPVSLILTPRGTASRRWRMSLIRKRAQVLGYVDAPSREVAEAAAASAFSLTDDQRKRLVVQGRG